MHEAGIIAGALDMAHDMALRGGGSRITRLVLRIGSLSSVVPESLRFAFTALAPGTIAEGAELDIDYIEAECHCTACNAPFPFAGNGYLCPRCGEASLNLVKGRELDLKTLEWI